MKTFYPPLCLNPALRKQLDAEGGRLGTGAVRRVSRARHRAAAGKRFPGLPVFTGAGAVRALRG